MKKYEFVDNDLLEFDGHILHRIKAVRSFGDVNEGEIGGYIEKEDNLSHDGNCWVYGTSTKLMSGGKVCGNAKIIDNATVCVNAIILGNADSLVISDNAFITDHVYIKGNVRISGNAKIYNYAEISDNADIGGNTVIDIYGINICSNALIHSNKDFAFISGFGIPQDSRFDLDFYLMIT